MTFLLHQVKTTTTTPVSGSGGGSGGGGEEPNTITVELYAKNRQTKLGSVNGVMNGSVQFSYRANNQWSGANVCVQPLNQSWSDTLVYTQTDQSYTGSFTYTINSRHVIDGKVRLFFDNDIPGFQVTSTSGSGSSGSGSSGSSGSSGGSSSGEEEEPVVTTELDPNGSGFPMEIILSPENNWTWQGNDHNSKCISMPRK